jgi:hypothetical protein
VEKKENKPLTAQPIGAEFSVRAAGVERNLSEMKDGRVVNTDGYGAIGGTGCYRCLPTCKE